MDSKRSSRPINRDGEPDVEPARPAPLFQSDAPADSPGLGARSSNGDGPVPAPGPAEADTEAPGSDPFDPAYLRLSQDFAAAVGVRKLLTTVPVRKPSKEWFVRTHPDPEYRLRTNVLELKEDRETYLVAPALWSSLATEATFSARLLITAVNRQGVLFLWPVRLPSPDGKIDDWSRSAFEAAERAQLAWVRVAANMGLGAYEIAVASLQAEPDWPRQPMGEILKVAFRDRYISAWDHPVLRRLRGEV